MKTNNKNKKDLIELGIYIFPALLIIGLIFIYPIIVIVKSSFFQIGSKTTEFTLSNFFVLFDTPSFLAGVKNNFLLLLSVPIIIIFTIIFAAILYERIFGWKFYRFIVFMAYILPVPVVGIIFIYIYQLYGVLNTLLDYIGLDFLIRDWFGNPNFVIWAIMSIIIWKMLGFSTVFLLARMMSIEKNLYEAAEIDGCNWFRKHIHITIPQSATTIFFLITINIITNLSWVFAYVYVTTTGGPGLASMITELTIYNYAFVHSNFSLAAATAFVLFIISLGFIIIQTRLRSIDIEV